METVISPGQLFAGAGEADITPGLGMQMAGDVDRRRPAEAMRNPLLAPALVAAAGGKKL